MAVEGLPGVDAAGLTSCLYTLLSPEERATRRADMKGMPWTDPRDFGMSVEQFDSTHVECPVLGGVSRLEYCWERCPEDEPVGRCPRRLEDSTWWWHDSVEAGKVVSPHKVSRSGAEQPVAPLDPPRPPPTSSSPSRRRSKPRDDDALRDAEVDVFDLFR